MVPLTDDWKAGNQIYVLWHAWLFHDSNLSFVGGITWDTCVPVTCEYYYCSLTFSAHIKKFLMCLAVVANGDYYARKAFQSYCLVYMDIALNRITKNSEREVVSNKGIKAKCWLKFFTGRPWTGTKCWGKVLMRFHGLLGQGSLGKPLWFWGSIDFGLMSPSPCELRNEKADMLFGPPDSVCLSCRGEMCIMICQR